jgi:HEAT repeat protein
LFDTGPDDATEDLVVAIAEVLRRKESRLREEASLVLLDFASEERCRSIVSILTDSLGDESPIVRQRALELFQRLGSDGQLKGKLSPLLTDSVPTVRMDAAVAIWHHTKDLKLAMAAIDEGLRVADPSVLCLACQLIGDIGDAASSYTDKLVALLSHDNDVVRANALRALGRVSNNDATPHRFATSLLKDRSPIVRAAAERLVANLGK